MGFVFQQPTMLRNLDILDNIILPSLRDNKKKQSAITEKASGLMRKAGIAELSKRGITEVSGGQLQRAGICRALMNEPKIIFGDEPTGSLNSKSADEIMALFAEINGGGTAIMLVTHDAKVAAYSQRVLFMADGKIVSELALSPYEKTNHSSRVEKITEKMREAGI
jgi:putative ABC transport system ATP-binding protein